MNDQHKERQRLTKAAIISNKIIKPNNCEHCGIKPSGKIKCHGDNSNLLHFHHTFPEPEHYLIGEWLCFNCHNEVHRKLKIKERASNSDNLKTKKCKTCGKTKPLHEYKYTKLKHHYNLKCRQCENVQAIATREIVDNLTDIELLKIVNTRFRYENGHLIRKIRTGNKRAGTKAEHICSRSGYVLTRINYKTYRTSNIIFLIHNKRLPRKHLVIDHIDNNILNNQIENLREVTTKQNGRNMKKMNTNTSGYTGITKYKYRSGSGSGLLRTEYVNVEKWRAQITVNRKKISLGSFVNFDDAVAARKAGELKYWGHYNEQ